MKRLILGILFVFMQIVAVNAKPYYNFPINSEGDCVIDDTISISVVNTDCYRIIKEWLYSISCVSLSFSDEKPGKSLTFNNVFYAQKRYNSFSGTYSDNLSIDCDMEIQGDKLYCHIYNIKLIKSYVGYDATASVYPVAERIHKINMAQKIIDQLNADTKISKADRREAIEEQKEILDYDDVLAKCYEVLMARFENLKKMVQWNNDQAPEEDEVPQF